MAVRIYETGNPPRLITSKPGQNASPSLRDDLKTFDSNWFNGCGVKFKYFGSYPAGFVFTYPYELSFIPKFFVQFYRVWNGNTQYFFYNHPNNPGYSVNPPNNAMLYQSSNGLPVAYKDRIAVNNQFASVADQRISIMVFEA
ncbi:hypothetical protein QBD01_002341 [Ochrobactrum sp. 19YEA23]|uniref:hypothetical protein n=1 Tax=Ochrobactrum sp. 19YEA23 TaxID=3039854 RepID=UPI00247857A9|nr:hypothetical protein [Ochrobactrum sp. 19YEA23]